LVKRKGFDTVIQALPEARKYAPELVYVYAGDGPEKVSLKNAAKGVKEVICLGSISEDDKWAWLRACDIFIMPARNINGDFEGFGIVYLEANLCGKPVIAGNSGGVKDAVKTTYTGLMVNPENTEDIANNIITLAKNKELREQMGENGRKRAVEEFKWENNIKQIHSIIYSI
jgi:phosphatidylinositol alpha-1,6-mannosyltransferase